VKEFFRLNKVLFQFLLGMAILLGLDEGKTLLLVAQKISSGLQLSATILSQEWWFSSIWGVPGGRIFLAIFFCGVLTNALFTIKYRNKPLSVLATSIELRFTHGGAEVVTTRTQTVVANRPGIAAYFFNSALDSPNGTFGAQTCWIKHPHDLSVTPRVVGNSRSKEIYLCYSKELPYGLVPRWILHWGPNRLPKFIDRYLVEQVVRSVSLNEYNSETPKFQTTSTRYQHLSINIKLDFSHDVGPRPRSVDDIRVVRRLANAVRDERANPTSTADIYEVDVGGGLSKDETITIMWDRHNQASHA